MNIINSNNFYNEDLKALLDLIQQNKIKPMIDKILPLEKAAQGLKHIKNHKIFNKIIIYP